MHKEKSQTLTRMRNVNHALRYHTKPRHGVTTKKHLTFMIQVTK